MKKLLFVSMIFLFAAVFLQAAAPVAPRASQEKIEVLKEQLMQDISLLNQAADKRDFKKVEQLGKQVIAQAKKLKKQVPANEKVAIINGNPTAGYVLVQAQVAHEFVLMAQIMQGKVHLGEVIDNNSQLHRGVGFFAWITGNASSMNVDFAPMAEQFREWKKCAQELNLAQERGVYVRPASEVCAQE